MTLEEKNNAEVVMNNFIDSFVALNNLSKEQLEYLSLLFKKFDIDIKLEEIDKKLTIPKIKNKKQKESNIKSAMPS